MKRIIFPAAFLCLASALLAQAPAVDPTDLRGQLAQVTRSLADLLKSQRQDSVSIGQFSGPPQTNAGPGIVQMLTEEFGKVGISVKKTAPIGIKGEFKLKETADPGIPTMKTVTVELKGTVVDRSGEVLLNFTKGAIVRGEFKRSIGGEENIVELAGATINLPLDTPYSQREGRIKQGIDHPTPLVTKESILSAGKGSPYGIEILVDGQPRPVTIEDGVAMVDLKQDELYQVRIINGSPYEAAVRVLIDGINVFTFSDLRQTQGPKRGQPRYTNYNVAPKGSLVIKGWHRTNQNADQFKLTDYEQSAAAKLGLKSDLGTITATFMAAWPQGSDPPEGEPFFNQANGPATGFGPPIGQSLREVARQTGVVRAAVTVHYSKPQ